MSPDTFNYIVPFMGEAVIITLKTPETARVNQYFTEQRKLFRTGGDGLQDKVDALRRSFFDDLLVLAEITRGEAREAYVASDIMDPWKEDCILKAFEALGRIKN